MKLICFVLSNTPWGTSRNIEKYQKKLKIF